MFSGAATQAPAQTLPTVSFEYPSLTEGERALTLTVPVMLNPAPTSDIKLKYTVEGTATPGSDFRIDNSGTVRVRSGTTSTVIYVSFIDDSAEEGDETVVLKLAGSAGYRVGSTDALTLTIADNDRTHPPRIPVFGFASPRLYVDEGSGTHEVRVNLSPAPTSDIALDLFVFATGSQRATLGADYTVSQITKQGTLLNGSRWVVVRIPVPAGATTATIPVTIVDDLAQEGIEDFVVKSRHWQRDAVVDPNHAVTQLRIIDNDGPSGGTPTASFASASQSAGEGSGTSNVTVSLSPAPASDLTLAYTVTGTAASGSDYTALSGTVSVPKGATTATIPVKLIDDGVNEIDETVVLTLAGSGGYQVGSPDTHTLTIAANDPPTASFASASQSAGEGSGTSNVTVSLSPAPAADLTLAYTVTGTATSGSDYTALSGTVSVPKGATTATIPVKLIDDSVNEIDETVVLTLAGSGGYQVGSPDTHTLTIAANDPPTASFASASQSAGEGSGTSNVTVNLSPAPASDLTLAYTVTGTATSGSDYTALSGTVSVPKGTTTATIPVKLIDDGVNENDETVVLTLTTGSGYLVGSPDTHTLTITANDPPTASFASASQSAGEGSGTSNVTVNLSPAPAADLTLAYTVTGTATSGSDYTALSGTESVPKGATTASIPVKLIDDSVRENDETVVLTLAAGAGYTVGIPDTHTLTIAASDGPPQVSFEPIDGRISNARTWWVKEGSGTHDVKVKLNPAPTSAITLKYSVGGNATPGSDYTPLSGTVSVPADTTTATIPVTIIDDNVREHAEEIVLSLIESTGYELTRPFSHHLIIDPSDGSPWVSFAPTLRSAGEGSGTHDVGVRLHPAPATDITFTYTVAGTATAGSDYGALSGTVTVPADTTTATIPVTVIDDSLGEGSETVVLKLSGSAGYSVTSPGTHTLTITDNDQAPVSAETLPAVNATAGIGGTEGGDVAFTISADPAPVEPLAVTLTVSQDGDFVAAGELGRRQVTIPASGIATVTLATADDDVDEPDGSVTVTLEAGSGYGLGALNTLTVDVVDNDEPAPASATAGLTVSLAAEHTSIAEAKGETKFTIALSRTLGAGETATVPFTVTGGKPNAHWNIRFRGVDNGPGVKRTATGVHSAVTFTEGGRVATLVLMAKPNDDRRERTISIAFGTGERAPSVSGVKGGIAPVGEAVSVAIIDDDKPRGLTVSLAAEHTSIAEAKGETKFTIALSRALGAGETATVPFTVTGGRPNAHWNIRFRGADNGPGVRRTATGTHSAVTFTEGGQTATLVLIAQPNDDRRNRTIGIVFGTGERAPSASGVKGGIAPVGEAIAVAIVDDDKPAEPEGRQAPEPVPVLTLSGGGAVAEGGSAGFTLTADPPPASDLAVTLRIAQTGDVAPAPALGERTVTMPGGRASLAVPVATAGDATDEPDGSLTATVAAVGDAPVESGASATVAVTDDDATAVTLSAPTGDIDEAAGRKTLTVTLGRALVAGETLAVPLTFGGAATPGSDYTVAAPNPTPQGVSYAHLAGTDPATPPTVTFAGPSATSATLLLKANADTTDEGASERVTVALGTLRATGLGGGAQGTGSASFAIVEPPPEVSIAAKAASIAEGGTAAFTVSASRAPGADLRVTLAVSEAAGADFVAADDEGAATVTIAKGTTEAEFSVPTVNDSADEPDGAVTVTVAAPREGDARYRVAAAPGDAATVTVTDDDAPAPSLSVDDATVKEGEGLMWFTIRLSAPSEGPVSVSYRTRESTPVSARSNVDYLAGSWDIHFRAGETEKTVWVYIYDDSHDEEAETFEFVLWSASGAPIADAVGMGTIVNDDPMPAAWLARFGRTVAEQALDGIAGRIAAPRTAGMQGTLAGQALSFGPAASNGNAGPGHAVAGFPDLGRTGSLALANVVRGFDGHGTVGSAGRFGNSGFGNGSGSLSGAGSTPPMQSHTMTARDALLGSSFSLTGEADASGGSMAFWGRAAQGRFDGREGTFSLDGEVTTGMLGADYARGRLLLGLALAQSEGEGDYRDTDIDPRPDGQTCPDGVDSGLCSGAVRAGDGEVEASLTAAIPYASLQASERLKLWGAAGYGSGEVTLKTALGGSYRSDTSWSMAAAGLRGDLLAPPTEGSGPALALTSDALWTRTASEKTRDLAASNSDATRLRLGLEGSYRFAMEGGGDLTPKLEIGARHDGGDAETGFGVEIGGGIAWVDPGLGLSLDVSGRTLIAHGNDDLKDRGYAASLAFDPDPATRRGPSLSLRQEFGGQANGGLDVLFAPATLDERPGGEQTSRWTAEAAYGFPTFGGRFTGSPHAGLGLSTGARDYSVGWRLTPEAASAPDFSFGFRATRWESDTAAPEHTVGFEASLRW